MANYKLVAKKHPTVVPYLRARIWQRQGETLIYRPMAQTNAFSTDSLGFRKSTFDGDSFSVDRSIPYDHYSVILGSSHMFGFGLPGNEDTMASRMAAKLGHPVLNMSLPEANTNDLMNAAAKHLDPKRLHTAILFPGGSFTRFCYTGLCSPFDGPPPLHVKAADQKGGENADSPEMFENLLRFQKRHIVKMAEAFARTSGSLYVVDEATFLEKSEPSEAEIEGKLGIAPQPQGQIRFERHKKLIGPYRERLFADLKSEGIKVLEFGSVDDITFIDEFHYDAPSVERIVERLYGQIKT